MRIECPHCDYLLVPFDGPEDADILLIGEFPGYREIESGIPFIGPTGDILRYEILKQGAFDYRDTRGGNLWQHASRKTCDLKWHVRQSIKEIRKRKFVLMMGSEFAGVYYQASTTNFCGRVINLPGGAKGIITYNPALLPKDSVGEFRFALDRFAQLMRGEKGLGRAYNHTALRFTAGDYDDKRSKKGRRGKGR